MPIIVKTPAGFAELLKCEREITTTPQTSAKDQPSYKPEPATCSVRLLADGRYIDLPISMCLEPMVVDDVNKPIAWKDL